MAEIKVGDVVNYVPHDTHRFDHVLRGGSIELPWVLGLKTIKNGKESVEELAGIRLTQVMEARKKRLIVSPSEIVSIRPNITWDALVTKVYPADKDSPEGHVDLDVDTERGFTLHYGAGKGTERVHVDPTAVKAHSCHAVGTEAKAALKAPDQVALIKTQANVNMVKALNDKVEQLMSQKEELEKLLAEKTPAEPAH